MLLKKIALLTTSCQIVFGVADFEWVNWPMRICDRTIKSDTIAPAGCAGATGQCSNFRHRRNALLCFAGAAVKTVFPHNFRKLGAFGLAAQGPIAGGVAGAAH